MKPVDMRKKSPDEIAKHLAALQEEQFKLRMSKATGQLSQTHRLRSVRREIATVRTVMMQMGN